MFEFSSAIQRVKSVRTAQVIGGLLDVECDETTTKSLLASVGGNFPIDELVEQCHRMKLILRLVCSQDPAVFNVMAKNDFHRQQWQSRNFLQGEQCELRCLASELGYLCAYSLHSCMSRPWSSGSSVRLRILTLPTLPTRSGYELISITNDNSMRSNSKLCTRWHIPSQSIGFKFSTTTFTTGLSPTRLDKLELALYFH